MPDQRKELHRDANRARYAARRHRGAADLVLVTLLAVLLASVSAFLSGLIPYPYGVIVVTALIAARLLWLRGERRDGRAAQTRPRHPPRDPP